MVKTDNERILLRDEQSIDIEGIQVECFLVSGHTWGHMVYLIDGEYLFTGDALWLDPDVGKSFINAGRGQYAGRPLPGSVEGATPQS